MSMLSKTVLRDLRSLQRRAATPAGGAWAKACGWGCLLILAGTLAQAGTDDTSHPITLPSGQEVTLHETLRETEPEVVRLRYVAPALKSALTRPSFEDLTEDLTALCNSQGKEAVSQDSDIPNATIIVSLSAQPTEFGTLNPDVPQVFEAFRIENGACILEMF